MLGGVGNARVLAETGNASRGSEGQTVRVGRSGGAAQDGSGLRGGYVALLMAELRC